MAGPMKLVVKQASLLLRIQEILSSNLNLRTISLGRGFSDFPHCLQANTGVVPQIRLRLPSTTPFIIHSLILLDFLTTLSVARTI
jgi:hypothetical protein